MSIDSPSIIGQFETPYGLANVVRTVYADGKTTAIILEGKTTGERIGVLSVNLPVCLNLPANQFYAKTWSENAPLRTPALDSGLFRDTGERVVTGWVEAELWELVS